MIDLFVVVLGLSNPQLLDTSVSSGQPSVAGHGALQGSSAIIGGYASLAAERPPSSQNIVPQWAQPYSDKRTASAESSPANRQSVLSAKYIQSSI